MNCRLFFEKIQESLAIAVLGLGTGAASLFFDENFRFKQRAHIIVAFVDHPGLNRLDALIERRRIEIQTVSAGMKIRIAMTAFIRDLYLVHHLYFSSTVIASRNHVKLGFDSSAGSFLTRGRLRPFFPVRIHITGLTIFSGHLTPCPNSCLAETRSESRFPEY